MTTAELRTLAKRIAAADDPETAEFRRQIARLFDATADVGELPLTMTANVHLTRFTSIVGAVAVATEALYDR